jgi:uncharacterized caspase-like protein
MAKKALLVGINRYKIPGADLRGCVNDVKNLRAVLTTYYGFVSKNIKTLTDYAATTKAMRDAVATLVKGAKKGDVLLLHYSGHGANVPDKNGDEADRRDEILCPTDLDWKALLDDWLRATFNQLPAGMASRSSWTVATRAPTPAPSCPRTRRSFPVTCQTRGI